MFLGRPTLIPTVIGSVFSLAMVTSCGSEEHCDATALTEALAAAVAGDRVEMGACSITGSIEIPSGVTLSGKGTETSHLIGPADHPAVLMASGQRAAVLEGVHVESSGPIGIISSGTGEIALSRVRVTASMGLGIGVENASRAVLTDVSITGPVTKENAQYILRNVTAADTGIYGFVAINSRTELNNVTTTGFALAGALFVEGNTTWNAGNSSNNLGVGIQVEGGTTDVDGVEITGTMQGSRLVPSYGAAFYAGATISTSNVDVTDTIGGIGIFHNSGRGTHTNLVASNNSNGAVWTQSADALSVAGELRNNSFAGVVALDSENIEIHDLTVSDTKEILRTFGTTGTTRVGDGLQIVRSTNSLAVRDVVLDNNERVGILLDTGGQALSAIALTNISVTVTSTTQAGAVAQGGAGVDWDSNITRSGTTRTADQAFGTMETVELIGPADRPRDTNLANQGLSTLFP